MRSAPRHTTSTMEHCALVVGPPGTLLEKVNMERRLEAPHCGLTLDSERVPSITCNGNHYHVSQMEVSRERVGLGMVGSRAKAVSSTLVLPPCGVKC